MPIETRKKRGTILTCRFCGSQEEPLYSMLLQARTRDMRPSGPPPKSVLSRSAICCDSCAEQLFDEFEERRSL